MPLDAIGFDRSTTPTGAPAFDGNTLNVTSSPGTNIFRVQPCPDNTPGLFSSPDANLESEVRVEAERQLQKAALQDGILKTAGENARNTMSSMLQGLGFREVEIR